jgi:hypothetical protein
MTQSSEQWASGPGSAPLRPTWQGRRQHRFYRPTLPSHPASHALLSLSSNQTLLQAGLVAFKLYPAGATTNSDSGVTDFTKCLPTLRAMAEVGACVCAGVCTLLSACI